MRLRRLTSDQNVGRALHLVVSYGLAKFGQRKHGPLYSTQGSAGFAHGYQNCEERCEDDDPASSLFPPRVTKTCLEALPLSL